jgi:hypothetical protein
MWRIIVMVMSRQGAGGTKGRKAVTSNEDGIRKHDVVVCLL